MTINLLIINGDKLISLFYYFIIINQIYGAVASIFELGEITYSLLVGLCASLYYFGFSGASFLNLSIKEIMNRSGKQVTYNNDDVIMMIIMMILIILLLLNRYLWQNQKLYWHCRATFQKGFKKCST